jgi:hypothetical protein
MKHVIVRYKVKPERAAENEQLVRDVYAELHQTKPAGFHYATFQLDDGVSFVHVAIEHDVDHPGSLQDVPAFQAFLSDISNRCEVPPVATGATVVGRYH